MKAVFGFISMVVVTAMLAACGSDSDNPAVKEGVFIDSAVQGLFYTSGSQTGTTDGSGTFRYEVGKRVEFRIGDVVIGSAKGASVITPVTLVGEATDTSNTTVQNIARFLQSLDSDGDVTNGITISDTTVAMLENGDVDFTQNTDAFETEISIRFPDITLVPLASAVQHLDESIKSLEAGYSLTDLAGTWYSTGLFTPGAGAMDAELSNYGVEAATLVVQSDGSFQYRIKHSAETETGTLTISAAGFVDMTTGNDHVGWYMNADKNVMTLAFDNTTHREQGKILFVKKAATYSQSDLTGYWHVASDLTPGEGATLNELANFSVDAGSLVVDADGSFQWSTTTESETGTVSISEAGEVNTGSPSDHLGWYMNAGKDVMTLVFNNPTYHEQGSIVYLKQADSYVASDLTGTWHATSTLTPGNGATSDALSNFNVDAGTLVVESNGSFQWSTQTENETGVLSISATGEVNTASAGDHIGWYMNAGKNMMVLVFNNTTYREQGMIVFVKSN